MSSEAHVLERPRHVSTRDGDKIAKRNQTTYSDHVGAIEEPSAAPNRGSRQLREWLLLLLRFAITLDPADQSATHALADEIDALGLAWRPSGPTFFRRTTREVCNAITALDDPKQRAVLKRHIRRIDNPALRRAFQAALNMEEPVPSSKRERQNLWAGLR